VAVEGAECFAFGLSLADAPVEVGARFGVVLGADDRDRVDRVVDLAVTAAVESVPDGLARGRGQWGRSVAAGEGCLALEARRVAGEQLRGRDWPDSGLLEEVPSSERTSPARSRS
jgi:hypothetical protein